jgi:hypothetical protein
MRGAGLAVAHASMLEDVPSILALVERGHQTAALLKRRGSGGGDRGPSL